MTPRVAIDRAKKLLIDDRDLTSHLNRHGSVRVPVPSDLFDADPPTNDGGLFVTFTIEDGYFGRRLFAEFQGYKEFAA